MDPNERRELEFLIQVAQSKIEFFDSCQIEPFPSSFPFDLGGFIDAVNSQRPINPQVLEALSLSMNVAHRNLNYLIDNFDSSPKINDIDAFDLIKKYFGIDIYKFFEHDRSHLSDILLDFRNHLDMMIGDSPLTPIVKGDQSYYVDAARKINQTTEKIARMYAHPWRLVKYLAEEKLEIPHQYERVNVQEMFRDVAEVLGSRFEARVFFGEDGQTPSKKSITVLGQDVEIIADRGLVWSIVYNNLKNSLKKFEEEEQLCIRQSGQDRDQMRLKYIEGLPKERVARAATYNINHDYVAIVFSDSGNPIDLNQMAKIMSEAIQKYGLDNVQCLNRGPRDRFGAWQDNDFAFSSLTTEDLTGVAFQAHMSGSKFTSITSGMGLYGTRMIVENLGGAILYTTRFADQTPVFMYILPRNPDKKDRAAVSQLRQSYIDGSLRLAA